MGLTFKPDIDDIRESPALKVVNELKKCKVDLLIVEPNIYQNAGLVDIKFAIENADIIAILVSHKGFKKYRSIIKGSSKKVLDFCGLLN